ncbi:MAG TPA: DNA repair ATPase, partial [Streptomyces sp.]|nr:DNA repair ATPase [Streptomyces sp.]
IAEHADGLRLVTDVVGGLDAADAAVRTALLERVGEVTGAVNGARAAVEARRRELAEAEAHAEYTAERALFAQALAGALAAADSPEDCDAQSGRLLARLSELQSRFGASATHLAELAAQQDEVQEAFAARKQAQLDERARRVERLTRAARSSLDALTRRAAGPDTLDALHALFAADPLAARVRGVVDELRAAGETVAAAELEGRLTAARQEAALALRDRADLRDGTGAVRLGRHRFAVHDRPFALTLVPQGDELQLTVTGTDYRAPVRDPELEAARRFWDQPLASESPEVYRAEHLAAAVLARAERGETSPAPTLAELTDAADGTADGEPAPALLVETVRSAAAAAYDEGYDRGVHDHDAAAVLHTVLRLRSRAGLLRFTPGVRAAAQLWWTFGTDRPARAHWTTRARSLARARTAFGPAAGQTATLTAELAAAVRRFLTDTGLPCPQRCEAVGGYLLAELATPDGPRFVTGAAARTLTGGFRAALGDARPGAVKEYEEDLAALAGDHRARHQLVAAWLGSYARGQRLDEADLPEAVALELCGADLPRREVTAPPAAAVTGLRGTHPRVTGGELALRLDEFLARTDAFRAEHVPAHRAFTRRRAAVLAAERDRLQLDAHMPHVVPGFVRNRLIDEVYLPLLGDNLARQLGTADADRRTDSQGLLLLLSPPGYGKTTLIEYVAARLGMLLVTVDGPALGRHTTSLDPAAAPDAAARREVEKIDLALRMGSGVFLHLDDIQHTSPELLQRFVPLCDTQRRIDGAAGRYDLRGKPFAVCMSGNPFTASGARFHVPDMLANRADIRNLGEVLAGREELFALSHVENALTAHPVLAPLAAREHADLQVLLRMAEGDAEAHADRLVHPYAPAELQQILAVLRRLLQIRRTLLTVNAAYIASAGQDDATRSEPPFALQGSYRDTVRLAARIEPVMNDAEVEALLDDHYRAEARTLTAGAEANLLKLAELRGRLTADEARRWAEIKQAYRAQPAPSGG